jgi:hypothetical protein
MRVLPNFFRPLRFYGQCRPSPHHVDLALRFGSLSFVDGKMFRHCARRMQWMGGTHTTAVLGGKLQQHESQYIQMERQVVLGTLDRDNLTAPVEHWRWEKYQRQFRGDIYDEIAKLPLRFALHPCDTVVAEMNKSAVGYAPPLGPADPQDTIPFHIHRRADGTFGHEMHSTAARIGDPRMMLRIYGIDGDVFRFEEELIKILPSFRTFVRDDSVRIWNAGWDVVEVLEHWYIALGF